MFINLMTEETPAKVMSLLGTALVSMAFTFAITVSQASFTKVYNPIPDTFAPQNVMAVLDNVSNSYSKAVYANLVEPEAPGYALAADNLAYIGHEAGSQLLSFVGLGDLAQVNQNLAVQPQVAGASTHMVTSKYYPASGGGPGIFSLLIGSSE